MKKKMKTGNSLCNTLDDSSPYCFTLLCTGAEATLHFFFLSCISLQSRLFFASAIQFSCSAVYFLLAFEFSSDSWIGISLFVHNECASVGREDGVGISTRRFRLNAWRSSSCRDHHRRYYLWPLQSLSIHLSGTYNGADASASSN